MIRVISTPVCCTLPAQEPSQPEVEWDTDANVHSYSRPTQSCYVLPYEVKGLSELDELVKWCYSLHDDAQANNSQCSCASEPTTTAAQQRKDVMTNIR
jgi:hypothetical protein